MKKRMILGLLLMGIGQATASDCPHFSQEQIDGLLNGHNVMTAQGTFVLSSHNDVRDNIKHALDNAKKRRHVISYTCKVKEDGFKINAFDGDQKLFSFKVTKLKR